MNLRRLRPYVSSAPHQYSQMLPPDPEAARAASDSRLQCLACSMRDKMVFVPSPLRKKNIPAGYTYFGQLIDHDLTYDTSPLPDDDVRSKSDETTNFRRSWLNLENIYGDGPGSRDSGLYEPDEMSFRLGVSLGEEPVIDVPLDRCSMPLAADPRNLENSLIRQIHAMFLKLHNIAVGTISQTVSARKRFSQARQRVCHQYQWLVRHDFLRRFCDKLVYQSVIDDANPLVDWNCRFSIPVEFAQAAFRFGHSMVRPEYNLGESRNTKTVPVHELFRGKRFPGPLLAEHKVDWAKFLLTSGVQNPEFAARINTSVAGALFRVPTDVIKAFVQLKSNAAEILVLPVRTMKRGVASHLSSGQTAQKALGEDGIFPFSSEINGGDPWADLKKCELQDHTPLWYYILLEAEVNQGGLRLGPVGSRIVAEVIEGALWANEDSFLRQYGRCWRPQPWPAPHGPHLIESLHDLAVVVGLALPKSKPKS